MRIRHDYGESAARSAYMLLAKVYGHWRANLMPKELLRILPSRRGMRRFLASLLCPPETGCARFTSVLVRKMQNLRERLR